LSLLIYFTSNSKNSKEEILGTYTSNTCLFLAL
jgi:hypothetical protein